MFLIRIKGKVETPYEAKTGTARRAELIDNPITRTVIVLWDGEKEEERVRRDDIEMIT